LGDRANQIKVIFCWGMENEPFLGAIEMLKYFLAKDKFIRQFFY
jgi:hypothetical protein